METYELEGFYENDGMRGGIKGSMQIDQSGILEGEVIDGLSVSPNQQIRGRIAKSSFDESVDEVKLMFFKSPQRSNLANLIYSLKGFFDKNAEDFSGEYAGEWHALPEKFYFDHNSGIFIATINPILMNNQVFDYAELVLRKR